jgi:hypothetical protein
VKNKHDRKKIERHFKTGICDECEDKKKVFGKTALK